MYFGRCVKISDGTYNHAGPSRRNPMGAPTIQGGGSGSVPGSNSERNRIRREKRERQASLLGYDGHGERRAAQRQQREGN